MDEQSSPDRKKNFEMKTKMRTAAKICFSGLLAVIVLFAVLDFRSDLNKYLKESTYTSIAEISADHEIFFRTHLDGAFDTLQTLTLSYSEEELYGSNHIFEMMDRLTRTTDFRYFAVMEKDGVFVANDGYSADLSVYPIYERIMRGEPVISEPVSYSIGGEDKKAILMAYPVIREEKTEAAIIGIYEFDGMDTILMSNLWKGAGYSTVIDQDGNVIIFDDNPNRLFRDENIYESYENVDFMDDYSLDQMKKDIKDGKTGYFTYNYQGSFRIAYYNPMKINNWVIITTVPDAIVQDKVYSITKITNRLLVIGVSAFLILLLWIWGRGRAESQYFKEMASKDSMTGLLNKATTEKRIRSVLRENVGESHALLLFDIDDFKEINDALGHQSGDEAIMKTAALLRGVFSMNDIVGRIGGDEFAVLYKNPKNRGAVEKQAQEVLLSFERLGVSLKKPVSCSIGVAFSGKDSSDYEELFKMADDALYQSKKLGKGQCTIGNDMTK